MDDFEALRLPGTAKVAGRVGLLTGVFECVLAAQTVALLRGVLQLPVAGTLFALGVVIVYAGARVSRGSGKGAIAAVVAASFSTAVTCAWFLYTIVNGVVSPLAFFVMMLSIVTIATSAVALPKLRKIDEARARLRAEGLDAGL